MSIIAAPSRCTAPRVLLDQSIDSCLPGSWNYRVHWAWVRPQFSEGLFCSVIAAASGFVIRSKVFCTENCEVSTFCAVQAHGTGENIDIFDHEGDENTIVFFFICLLARPPPDPTSLRFSAVDSPDPIRASAQGSVPWLSPFQVNHIGIALYSSFETEVEN